MAAAYVGKPAPAEGTLATRAIDDFNALFCASSAAETRLIASLLARRRCPHTQTQHTGNLKKHTSCGLFPHQAAAGKNIVALLYR